MLGGTTVGVPGVSPLLNPLVNLGITTFSVIKVRSLTLWYWCPFPGASQGEERNNWGMQKF